MLSQITMPNLPTYRYTIFGKCPIIWYTTSYFASYRCAVVCALTSLSRKKCSISLLVQWSNQGITVLILSVLRYVVITYNVSRQKTAHLVQKIREKAKNCQYLTENVHIW